MTVTRTFLKAYSSTEPTGWSRREAMVDAQDCDTTAKLTQRGAEQLSAQGDTKTLEVAFLQTENSTFEYGTDFNVGDTITAVFPDVVTMVTRIISVTVSYDEEGEHITLTLGKEYPDLKSIVKIMNSRTSALVRR